MSECFTFHFNQPGRAADAGLKEDTGYGREAFLHIGIDNGVIRNIPQVNNEIRHP